MATIEWSLSGREFGNCNCAYGCPCQFNALPTRGFCEAVLCFQFDEGRFGDVRLDGLRAVAIYHWPGPVHLGSGAMQLVIDERADAPQRDALTKIMSGKETNDGATMWWVFATMCSTQHPPLFLPIELEIDVDGRTGHMLVKGVAESSGEPIRNPVTGLPHRARINLPNGFEYRVAEVGSGRTRASGKIELDLKDTHAQFANVHLSHQGVTERATA